MLKMDVLINIYKYLKINIFPIIIIKHYFIRYLGGNNSIFDHHYCNNISTISFYFGVWLDFLLSIFKIKIIALRIRAFVGGLGFLAYIYEISIILEESKANVIT